MKVMLAFLFPVIWLSIYKTNAFQFKSPYISANPTTINTLSQYTIFLQRQFTQNVSNTAWNTTSVPAGSIINIVFPVQYTLTGTQSCDLIVFGVDTITTFTCTPDPSTNTLTISNAIPTNQYLSDITIVVSNVRNPFPAVTTSPFTAVVGDDFTAVDPFAAVSLTPDTFQSVTVTFVPSIANTTGNMIVSIQNSNRLPVGAYFVIKFPMYWAADALNSYRIPINNTMVCSSIMTVSSSIVCTGTPLTQTLTISSLSSSQIPATSTLQFSISNLFPPPTQNPSDTLTISSQIIISGTAYQIQSSSSVTISGIVAKSLPDLIISATSTTKTINTNIGLRINFTLQDTITRDDYFQVGFPLGTSITYTTSSSSLSLATNNVTYNSNTGVLTIYQSSLSSTRFQGFAVFIAFLTYRTPNTTKPTDPIVFRIMKAGQAKMRGSAIFVADPKNYSMTATASSTAPNALSTYTLSFPLSDPIDRTGYLTLTLPPQLLLPSSLSCTISSSSPTSINTTPTLTLISNNTYRISNLNRTSSTLTIPIQTLTLTLVGLQNPNSVRSLSSFGVVVYFGSEGFVNANAAQSNSIGIVGGLVTGTVGCATNVTSQVSSVTVNFTITNAIPAQGKIQLTIPTQLTIFPTTTPTLSISTTPVPISSTFSSPTLTLTMLSAIPASTTLSLLLSPIESPSTTAPTSPFTIQTLNENSLHIDTMTDTTLVVTMTQPRQLSVLGVSRDSVVNYGVGGIGFGLEMRQSLITGVSNVVNVEFPVQFVAQLTTVKLVYSDNTSTTLTYTTPSSTPLRLSLLLPSSLLSPNTTTILLTNFQNPPSLKPTSTGIKVSIGYNISSLTYTYAYSESSVLQNVHAAQFVSIDYAYSSGVLFSEGNLVVYVGFVDGGRVGGLGLQLAGVVVKNNVISCNSSVGVSCTLTSTSPYIISITPSSSSPTFPNTLTLTLSTLLTPTSYSTSYPPSILTSYDPSQYVINRNTNKIVFTASCSLPCLTCILNQPSQCLSCYRPQHNITSLPYYVNSVGMLYGGCYVGCVTGYTENVSNAYNCMRCDGNCKQCNISVTNCTTCSSGLYLYTALTNTGSCVSVCPAYYYANTNTGTCVACMNGCQLCSTGSTCSKCASGYYLYNGACGTACPVNISVANTSTRVCDLCSTSCATCSLSTTTCTSCVSGLVLSNNTCVSSCPSLTMIPINNTCQSCTLPCLTCSISLTNCTSCSLSSPSKYLSSNQCLQQCPSLSYSTASLNYVCRLCSGLSLNCSNCSYDGLYCLSCDAGYVMFNGTMCLGTVPNGYVNINGTAVLCNASCTACSVAVDNCTACTLPLYLYNNQCIASCPNTTSPTSPPPSCTPCSASCLTCSLTPTTCTSCSSPTFLSLTTHTCVSASSCDQYTYANSTTNACAACVSPCLQCTSGISCSSCVRGYYFQSLGRLCLDVCPFGWVGVVDVCLRCQSPCRYCVGSVDQCTACVTGYYLNLFTHQCLVSCPTNLTISNPVTMTCDTCSPPCLTCQSLTTLCLSCNSITYLLGSQCLSTCPSTHYPNILTQSCTLCPSVCLTCRSATQCLSCSLPLHLYNGACVGVCPATHGIVDLGGNLCRLCGLVVQGCVTCVSDGKCIGCMADRILFQGICYQQCPTGYVYNPQSSSCITASENANNQLTTQLSSSSIFPLPFTCIGFCLFICCLMSKLQNKNTYLIGSAYCISGILEMSSLIFLLIKYLNYSKVLEVGLAASQGMPSVGGFPLLAIGLVILYGINVVGLVVQTPILYADQKFQNWLTNPFHKLTFLLITLFSFLTSYKLKLFLFLKLFNLSITRAQLQSISKFRIFNILSFLGVSHQIFIIYISSVMLTQLPKSIISTQIFLVFIDAVVIAFVSLVLAIVANKKEDDFFVEMVDGGYVLNKRVVVEGDDFGQEPLEPKYLKGNQNKEKDKKGMDSFQNILQHGEQQIYEDQQLSLSISQNRSEIDRRQRNATKKDNKDNKSEVSDNETQKSQKSKNKTKHNKKNDLHFTNQETSNPIKKQARQNQNQDLHESGKLSVVFDRDKYYDEAEVIKKNQTVLLESPAKSNKSKGIEKEEINKGQFDKNNGQAINNYNSIKNGSDKVNDNNENDQKNKNNEDILKTNGNNTNPNTKTNNQAIKSSNSQYQQIILSVSDTQQQQLQKTDPNKTSNNTQAQMNKLSKQRHQNQTKIYYENKDIVKNDEDQQIQNKIRLKQSQLQGLKRENSYKELRKSREKFKEKQDVMGTDKTNKQQTGKIYSKKQKNNSSQIPTQTLKSQKISDKLSDQQKTDKQISAHLSQNQPSQNKSIKRIQNMFDQEQQQIVENNPNNSNNLNYPNNSNNLNYPNNSSYPNNSKQIPQVSTLIRQKQQLKNNYLPEQKQHQTIGQEIQLTNSMAVSKIDNIGNAKNISNKKKKTEDRQINQEFIQEQSASNSSAKSKNTGNKLKTNNESKIEQQQINMSKKSWFHEQNNPIPKIQQKIQTNQKSPQSKKDKKNIQNMFDSIILNQDDETKKSTKKENNVDQQIVQNKSKKMQQKSNKSKGIDIGIGEQLQDQNQQKSKKRLYNNVFQYEQQEQSMEDSGLEDSRPDGDQEINHHPLKSSFATQRKSQDSSSAKHPLVGLLQANQKQTTKNQIPKMEDEDDAANRQDQIKTKLAKYANHQKTQRRAQERPPIQRPSSTQKNRIYAAGLRHLQDQTITKKHSYENPLHEKQKILRSYDKGHEDQLESQKRASLYNVPLKKLSSRQASSSDHTQDILIRPGYFNSSSEDVSIGNQKYTSTMNVDSGNQVPDKPTIGITSRTSMNRVSSTSHERGGRMKRQIVDQNVTAGESMYSKKESMQDDHEDMEEDQLNQFYGKIKTNKNRSPKRSKSKQRNPSRQSVKRMKEIEKVYLQRLDGPKKKP